MTGPTQILRTTAAGRPHPGGTHHFEAEWAASFTLDGPPERTTLVLTGDQVHVGPLILVNQSHGFQSDRAEAGLTALAANPYGVRLDRHYATVLAALLDQIGAGDQILAVSGWRSQAEQTALYAGSLAEHGEEFTVSYVARPGHSEHHTGLAVDLALNDGRPIDEIRPDFPYDGICGRFRVEAARFGLIERYPAAKRHLTGIAHEPWHFRYVGAPHAEIMAATGDTFEEYHQRLRRHPWGRRPLRHRLGPELVEVGYLPTGAEPVTVTIEAERWQVSGDNVDGFIITAWRRP